MSNLLNHSSGLIAFVRAVESGSFSAAARSNGTTPSAISKSIARLEIELDIKLFRRSTRNVSLTPEGQAFFNRIAPLLNAIDDSADSVRPSGSARGHLRISMPSDLGRLLLPAIHSVFLRQHPEVDLDLTLVDHHVDLISEGYDILFRVGSLPDSALKGRALARMKMVLVASPSFLTEHGAPKSIDDLRNLQFVRYQLGGQTFPVVFEDGTTVVPNGRIGLDSGFGLRTAVLDGMGVAYLMKCTVKDDLDRGALVELLPDHRLPSPPLNALHAFGALTPIRVRLFADFVRNEVLKRV